MPSFNDSVSFFHVSAKHTLNSEAYYKSLLSAVYQALKTIGLFPAIFINNSWVAGCRLLPCN
jgi:hypothetical protein